MEYIHIPIKAVDTHRARPDSPTRVRNARVDMEKVRELSDRTATALSIGEGDKVVKTVGGPQFRFTSCDTQETKWYILTLWILSTHPYTPVYVYFYILSQGPGSLLSFFSLFLMVGSACCL